MFAKDLLKGQKFIVTGGGTGLGKAMTTRFAALGAEVIIWGRRGGVLDETANEINALPETIETGGKVSGAAVDIRNPMAIEEAMDAAFAGAPITGLVNNAAGNFISRTEDLSPNAFNAIASIVLHGTFNTTNAAGKRWIAGGHKGNILSIVTTWVWTGGPFTVPSAMSKAGVAAMTQSLAVEWGPKGIRANAIAPGPFYTEGAFNRLAPKGDGDNRMTFDGRSDIPLRRYGNPPELADLAVFLMAPQTEYVTGEVIAIDGGQWLATAGTAHKLTAWGDAEWNAARQAIEKANAKDKAQRTAG
jgi:NAD(P)-dependent dehydrogenase (short-subunit alcohol dehydrogenase family)